MGNRNANSTVFGKIKSCMRELIKNVRLFEGNSHGRGYRINCDVSERKQFCKLIKQMFYSSDYVKTFYKEWEKWEIDADENSFVKIMLDEIIDLYVDVVRYVTLLENTEESNMYSVK